MKLLNSKSISWFKSHPFFVVVLTIFAFWCINKLWHTGLNFFAKPELEHVETVVLKSQMGEKHWQAVGTVKAVQDVEIASEVSGTVENIVATSDQTVKQGDELINLRHDDISANLQKDEAQFAQKQSLYKRLLQLAKSNNVSQEALSEAMSAYEQASAIVKADQAELDKYSIKAAFNGQVGIWQVTPGQLVKQGDMLVTLTDQSQVLIDFMLPPTALSNVQTGDTIHFTTESYPNRIWSGKVVAVDPQLDPITRSMQLRAQIDNRDGKLAPHLFGQVTVIKPTTPQLMVPQEAVIYDPQGASVYVLHNKIATQQLIKLGEHIDNNVIVTSGLKAGDEVVTAGMMKLFSGTHVIINSTRLQK